jgi:tol-pal system protein YbgF
MTSRRQAFGDRALINGASTLTCFLGLALTAATASADVAVIDGGSGWSQTTPKDGLVLVQNQQDPAARARDQALIGRLEEEIRRLTGRIEQLEFQQRNVDRRVDQLVQDLDQRLRSLESGGGGVGTEGAVSEGPESPESQSEEFRAQQALEELTNVAKDGQLGSVPESAIEDLPRPDPSEVAAPDRNTLTPEQQYEKAVQLLQAGDYQGAQGGLETFLEVHDGHQLSSNAAYWLAETHYVRKNYSASAAAFARNYRNYGKDSPKAVDNLLKLGMSLSNLGEQDKACLTYDELTSSFPNRPAHIQQALSRERARAQCG